MQSFCARIAFGKVPPGLTNVNYYPHQDSKPTLRSFCRHTQTHPENKGMCNTHTHTHTSHCLREAISPEIRLVPVLPFSLQVSLTDASFPWLHLLLSLSLVIPLLLDIPLNSCLSHWEHLFSPCDSWILLGLQDLPRSPNLRGRKSTEYWVELPVLYSRSLLIIYFIYSSVYLLIPKS